MGKVLDNLATASLFILAIMKSFFHAITDLAWGLISIFGFNLLMTYLATAYEFDLTTITPLFFKAIFFISDHIPAFFWTFFAWHLYFNVNKILERKDV